MVRLLFYAVLILAGLFLGPTLIEHKGYVLISVADWTVETSLVAAVVIAVVGFGLLQLVEWVVVKSVNVTGFTLAYPTRRRRKKARQQTLNGALALAEQDWQRAETLMARGVQSGPLPAVNLLAAARAAHHRGDDAACQSYLDKAEAIKGADTAVALTRIRYCIEDDRLAEARQRWDALSERQRQKPQALRQALNLYRKQGDWDALARLIPQLARHKVLPEAQLAQLPAEVEVACLAQQTALPALEQRWKGLSRALRRDIRVQLAYLRGLARFEAVEVARKLLLEKLDRSQPQPELLALLPEIAGDAAESVTHVLQRRYPDHRTPALLDCYAALAEQQQQWREALSHRQAALEGEPTPARWRALGAVQERLGLRDAALNSYRQLVESMVPERV
ncbi:heme biosynthesis HemY N-terminal domain-containing protein [Ferrimonas gelatinilytica]|uniref:Heme biosynthesis HemY N-terminal domain-containing protein n=1 Tax=Ferrimonas gelatinilytica TaxID=1255257 RepID=A0ABP9RU25_9GAMM